MTEDVELLFVDDARPSRNGAIKRRIAIRIDGKDKEVVTLRTDSDHARARQAKRWADAYGIPTTVLEGRLRRVSVVATQEESQCRALREGVRGAKRPAATPLTLDEARPAYGEWLSNLDPEVLDVVFGTTLAHRLVGDPVWMFIVGAPGDGKTEVLRSLGDDELIYTLSSLTPGALISGYITEGEDPSLLPKLDGKLLVVKDFTAVLTMREESRAEVLGTLRDAYDGEAAKAFGTGETRSYRSRFGLLAAVTPVVDRYWSVSAQLGERFLRFRVPGDARESKVRCALRNTNEEETMRQQLSAAALGVLAQELATPTVPDAIEGRLIHLAEFVALGRSEVSRNRDGVIQYVPAPEVGTRVAKALKKLGQGIAMARGNQAVDNGIYEIVRRVGLDTIPSMRARLLEVLWRLREARHKTVEVADSAEVPTETAKVWLDDLRLLGIADRGGDPHSGYTWALRPTFRATIVNAGVYGCGGGGFCTPDPPGAIENGVRGTKPPPVHTPIHEENDPQPDISQGLDTDG